MDFNQRFAAAFICAGALGACGGGGSASAIPAADSASQTLTVRFVPVQVIDWPAPSEVTNAEPGQP